MLKDDLFNAIKLQGKSRETAKTYWIWIEKFCRYLKSQNGEWVNPVTVHTKEVTQWLTYLAVECHVSKSTQNTALQALCYLFREVFNNPLDNVAAIRAKRPQHVRDVLDVSEVERLFNELNGVYLLSAKLIYASGFRIGELVNLRIKDISFDRNQIHVRSGKGDKDRYVSFPKCIHEHVASQIDSMRVLHACDLDSNPNGVSLPDCLRKKFRSAPRQFAWYYLFCSDTLSRSDDGVLCRHHRDPDAISREINHAAQRAGIEKRVTSHVLRHCYATHANEMGVGLRELQVLLGHNDISTTEIYVHANKNNVTASQSPIDAMTPKRAVKEACNEQFRLRVFAG